MDYTLTNKQHIDEKFLVDTFQNIAKWIYEETGIEIPPNTIRFEIYQNKNGENSVEGKVGYIGPLRRRRAPVRIKLDLTVDEILVLPPVIRPIHHPYSDNPDNKIKATCYSFQEIFAEKIRALSQRARPRDLYDVIHLYRHTSPDFKSQSIFNVLGSKCTYKKIPIPTISLMEKHIKKDELASEWENMLGHQLPSLPPLNHFWSELPNLFSWLYGARKKIQLQKIVFPDQTFDEKWLPPSMIQSWKVNTPIELIRYAGANYLCVNITYNDKEMLVEPYDLILNKDKHVLLLTVEHETSKLLSYQIEKIQKINVSDIPFSPKYQISLTPYTFFEPILS